MSGLRFPMVRTVTSCQPVGPTRGLQAARFGSGAEPVGFEEPMQEASQMVKPPDVLASNAMPVY
jgi:hypothetical protein